MARLALALVAIATLVAAARAHARWESAQDNKSAAELDTMTTEALFNEAFDVCVRRALLTGPSDAGGPVPPSAAAASEYLNTVYPFVREKSGGETPPWMSELFTAQTVKECQRAFRTFVSSPESRPPKQESKPEPPKEPKEKKAAAPRPGGLSEQLPPWLAPR